MMYEISRPLPSELGHIWASMRSETHLLGGDIASLKDLIDPWGLSMLLFVGKAHGEVAALYGLYDVEYDEHGNPISAWTMLYVLPRFRGYAGLRLSELAMQRVKYFGFKTLYAECRSDNAAARCFVERLGFEKCGELPKAAGDCDIINYVWPSLQEVIACLKLAQQTTTIQHNLHSRPHSP